MEKKNIYQKLCYVQLNLKAPKSQYNRFGNYNYRNCEDIQEALKPLLKEMSAALVISDELIQVGERYYIKATAIFFDADTGERISNTAYAREEDIKKGMDASQITGSTSSYARKYALNGLFCIDDTKDADTLQGQKEPQGKEPSSKKSQSKEPQGKEPSTQKFQNKEAQSKESPTRPPQNPQSKEAQTKNPDPPERISKQQAHIILMELKRTGIGQNRILREYHISDIGHMTNSQFQSAVKILQNKPDKPKEDYSNTMPPDHMEERLPWNLSAG